jgi:protein-S-isoprenylcysteine O-methyltransferase Ste14
MSELIIVSVFMILYIFIEIFIRKNGDAKIIKNETDDKGSTNLLAILFVGIFIVFIITALLNYYNIGYIINFIPLNIIGIIVIIGGIIIRIIAMKTLNRYYTRTLHKTEEHKLVTNGIYNCIRHPGYLGSILFYIGGGMVMKNIFPLILITITVLLIYSYRINVEEKMLIKIFDEEYEQYLNKSNKLIPFLY